jgi:Flp pilus assembly protein TadB
VRRGPPITVKCECGERRELHYGERWRCEGCGRRYDTNRIPLEEYAGMLRARVRDRIAPAAVAVGLALVVVVLALVGRAVVAVILVPLTGFVWGSFIRPARRRRQYQAIADRPRWKISAD